MTTETSKTTATTKRVYEYTEIQWEGLKRKSLPLCPKCKGYVKELRRYPVAYTETYIDYECESCGFKFTVNWS